jgi:glycosyltransferase involved in cell wall biosynthesis
MIVGGGDLDTELRQRARDAGLGHRVTFTGNVLQDAIPSYLNAADLAIVPSVKDAAGNVDGLPNFLLEALVSGTTVVTTDVGGIRSVAKDGHTAIVVPPANADALAEAIHTMLGQPERRRALGAAARAELQRNRSWADFSEQLEAVYDRLAKESC